jgi:hypothetical protein
VAAAMAAIRSYPPSVASTSSAKNMSDFSLPGSNPHGPSDCAPHAHLKLDVTLHCIIIEAPWLVNSGHGASLRCACHEMHHTPTVLTSVTINEAAHFSHFVLWNIGDG